MRDGAALEATVALPPGDGPFPVALVRTAYNRGAQLGNRFTSRGIAFVIQDCRGRYGSDGEWYPFVNEASDGYDTLQWIGAQPWCNGKVGMYGPSYLAATQFYAAAAGSPYLAAINPMFMAGDLWQKAYYQDGIFSLALTFSWLCFEVSSRVSQAGLLPAFDVKALLAERPLLTLDEKSGASQVKPFRDFLMHDRRDAFWEALDIRSKASDFRVPALLTGGWYDYYPGEAFANYYALVNNAPTRQLATSHRVIIGPWTHGFGTTPTLGELDFGPDATSENDSLARWLECILKESSPEKFQAAPIRIFVMGRNAWRNEYEWPPSRSFPKHLYLRSNGSANTLHGDGLLAWNPPAQEPPDRFTYDPRNPVPTLGGNHSVGTYNPGLYEICLPGPYDQRANEHRSDMLVYTSNELVEDLEVTGPVWVTLFAATSARDTDFVVRLCDVYPDGRSINITERVIRTRFRKRDWARPELLNPGTVYKYLIELHPTSNLFFKRHKIRLQVTSSNFPLWDPNLNTGNPPALDSECVVAHQVVYHDAQMPSHVALTVVPSDKH